MVFVEARKLVEVKATKSGSFWTLKWEDENKNKRSFVYRGNIDQFAKFLKQIQAKDDYEQPKSYRSLTYKEIAEEIEKGTDTTIYVWSKYLKPLPAQINA